MTRVYEKVAFVAGAARGIGRAIALRLAEEGASLVIADIDSASLQDTASLIEGIGQAVVSYSGDLMEADGAKGFIDTGIDRFGAIDILVNNVGGAGDPTRLAKIDKLAPADWDHVLRLNLRPTYLCTHFAAQHMIERNRGNIICISSGSRNGSPWLADVAGAAAYSTAKAGLHGFVRDVAMELAAHNIIVNAVAPGPVDTDIAGESLRQLEQITDVGPLRLTPLKRLATETEIANAVLFLASDEASYITGQTLDVAGGR